MLGVIADYVKSRRHRLGQHVLFVGSGVRLASETTMASILEQLALEHCGDSFEGLPPERRGREALKRFAEQTTDHAVRCRLLQEKLHDVRPPEGYIRLASLIKDGYFPLIFTMSPDDLLEQSLSNQHLEPAKDYHLVVAGVTPPETYTVDLQESTRVAIIKCGGDVGSKYLPLSEAEIRETISGICDTISRSFKVLSIFTAYTERDKPFLACVPREGGKIFWVNTIVPMKDQELYEELKLESPASIEYHRLQPEVTELLEARHSARHLVVREAGTFNEFIANLHNRLYMRRDRHRRRHRRELTVLRGGPYRFLDYFDVNDNQFFYGREQDVETLLGMIQEHRLVVLFGRSGIGKTSLLRAGLMAELAKRAKDAEAGEIPWLTVYALCEDDPLDSVRQAALDAAEEAGFNVDKLRDHKTLKKFLRAVAEVTGRNVLVILDQFEEFFVKLGALVKQRFLSEIAECINTDQQPDEGLAGKHITVLLSIREDFVGELYELHEQLPTVMQHMYRLKKLTREQAENAIVKPAQNFGIRVEPELVERIIEDLSRDGIEPTQLQIVCDRLYSSLEPGHYVITERHYDRLGGTEKILSQYLDYALRQFPPLERRVARMILKHMVTGSELKALRPLERIAQEVGMDQESVERVLAKLVDFRLVRGVDKDRKRNYELVHEYLAEEIGGWLTDDELKLKDVQDLLTRELNNYEKFGLLMDAETLRIVSEQRERLSISPAELEMIILSAAASQIDVKEWMSRLPELGEARIRVLARMMEDSKVHVRRIAYEYLPEPVPSALIPQLVAGLRDTDETIRNKALQVLNTLQRPLLEALAGDGVVKKADAAFALAKMAPGRYITHLLDAMTDDDEEYWDVVTQVLGELGSEQLGQQVLERLVKLDGRAPWALAHLMGHMAANHQLLEALQRAVADSSSARLKYALGLALTEWRQFDEAEEVLRQAVAEADDYGAKLIDQALQNIGKHREMMVSGGDRWVMFRHDAAHSGAIHQPLRPPLKKIWSYRTGGTLMGSAVVSGGVVYFGSRDHNLYALTSQHGGHLWTLKTNDRIEATPAVSDGLVYIGSYDRRLYAADSVTGRVRWAKDLGSETRSSCTVADGRVWIGCRNGMLHCLNAHTGETLWQYQMADEISGSAAVVGERVIVGSWDSNICALEAVSGELLWQVATDGPVACSPAVDNGIVYCGSDDCCLYAIDLESGTLVWCKELGTQLRSSPALGSDRLVIGGINGGIFCVSYQDMELIWRKDAEEEVLSSPAIAGDVVYVGSKDGTLYALALDDGQLLWSYRTAYGIYSSPTIAEETLYVGLEHNELVAFQSAEE